MTTITPIKSNSSVDADVQAAGYAPVGKRGKEIFARLREISAIEKAARDVEDEKKALKAELDNITGGAKYATYNGQKIATRIDGHSVKTDLDALLIGWPEAHKAVVRKEPFSYYRQA